MGASFARRTQITHRQSDVLGSKKICRCSKAQLIQRLIQPIQRTPPTQDSLRSAHPLQPFGQGAFQPGRLRIQFQSHIQWLPPHIRITQAHPLQRNDGRIFDIPRYGIGQGPGRRVVHSLHPQQKTVDRASVDSAIGDTSRVHRLNRDPCLPGDVRGHRKPKSTVGRIDRRLNGEERRLFSHHLQKNQLSTQLIGGANPYLLEKSRKRCRGSSGIFIHSQHHTGQGLETGRVIDAGNVDLHIPNTHLRTTRPRRAQVIGSDLDDLGSKEIRGRPKRNLRKRLIDGGQGPSQPNEARIRRRQLLDSDWQGPFQPLGT